MSYSFNPLTEEELDAIDLIKEGVYNFEIVKSTRKVSKAGNAMAELQLNVWDSLGRTHCIFDYLVFSSVNLNIKKLSHFCKSVGLHEEYKRGELQEELERLSGKVEIGIQGEQAKPGGGFYPKKNIVVDYVTEEGKVNNAPLFTTTDAALNDDLPF